MAITGDHASSLTTGRAQEWAARAQARFPGGTINDFAQPDGRSLIVSRAEGAYLWDIDDRLYSDYLLSSGPMVLGHSHPRVVEALHQQLSHGSTYYLPSTTAIELAEEICRWVTCAEQVRFCSDGSEAVFYALRTARAHTGRELVLKFEGGFHGHTDYALQSFHPSVPTSFPTAVPDTQGIPVAVGESVLVAPYNDLDAVRAVMAEYGTRIAAVLVEPVQRAIEPQPDFLGGLRSLCDTYGSLLVFDEVVTGFRLSMGGAQQHYGVIPDLCSLGKSMNGGTPLACVAGAAHVMEWAGRSDRAYMSGTLNGNPLGCAAGLATLRTMEEIDACALIEKQGLRLQTGLKAVIGELGINATVIGPPAFSEIVFGQHRVTDYAAYRDSDRDAAVEFGTRMLDEGILVRPGSKMYVSAVHTDEQIDETVAAAQRCLSTMAAADHSKPSEVAS